MNKSYSHSIYKAFVLCLICFAFPNYLKAQNEDVIIIETYKPVISDAFKIQENPKIPDSTDVEKYSTTYQVNPVLYGTKFPVEPIKPAKMIGEPLTKFYKSYAKLGFGNKTTPLAEFYYSNLRSTSQSIGFYFNHFSSSGKIKKYAFPGFSNNDAGIYAKKFYKYHTLTANVDYKRDVVHYYGFEPSKFPYIYDVNNKDSIKQRLMDIGGQLKFFSTYVDSTKLNHYFDLKYHNASDLYDAVEDNIVFNALLNKNVKFLGKSIKNQNLSLKTKVDFYNDKNKIDTAGSAVISFMPQFSASYDIIRFNLGFNTSIAACDSSDIFFYPVANINFNLVDNIFILYAGIDGGLEKNNLVNLFSENPFINTKTLNLQYSNTKSRFYAGFRGSISSYLSFNANIAKSKIDNLPLFVNDSSLNLFNKFNVIYDNAGITNLHTEITYQKSEKLKIMLTSNYYEYKMNVEKRAWHKPGMNVQLSVNYNLRNKIILKTEVFALNGVDAKCYNTTGQVPEILIKQLKGTVDFNLGLEYRYSKILSGFINFNNIGVINYQKWYNYPTYSFTALAGITYSF